MSTILNPYLSFHDNAREAMEFYKSVFGGELTLSTFGETPGTEQMGDPDKIMHGQLETEGGLVLMGSDTAAGMPHQTGSSISVSLSGDDEAELRGYWDKLADGGTIALPLEKAPWGDSFGMIADRFGTNWMVNISGS